MTIEFRDGTSTSSASWISAAPLDPQGHFINLIGGGGASVGIVPTDVVKYISYLS